MLSPSEAPDSIIKEIFKFSNVTSTALNRITERCKDTTNDDSSHLLAT